MDKWSRIHQTAAYSKELALFISVSTGWASVDAQKCWMNECVMSNQINEWLESQIVTQAQ